ncbi:MAG TPA: hypothetical protein VFK57_07725 [Vicinamibacterales bacterium]|nr:hypothetical protein [Vicinamibacterales bacterium]
MLIQAIAFVIGGILSAGLLSAVFLALQGMAYGGDVRFSWRTMLVLAVVAFLGSVAVVIPESGFIPARHLRPTAIVFGLVLGMAIFGVMEGRGRRERENRQREMREWLDSSEDEEAEESSR